jgi:predicted transcriptional regulator of viral defense system
MNNDAMLQITGKAVSEKHRRPDHRLLFEIAADQGGYFTARQAHEAGFSKDLIRYYVHRGKFRVGRSRRGVYRLRDFPASSNEHLWAALAAAGPDAVISHESALRLHNLSDVVPRHIDLWIPYKKRWLTSKALGRGVKRHVARKPLRPEEVTIVDGLRATTPLRTLIDVAVGDTNPRQAVLAIKQASDRQWITRDALAKAAQARGDRRTAARIKSLVREAGA